MNCPNCGTPVGANDTYCSFCGARVNNQPIVKQQPQNSNPSPNRNQGATTPKQDDESKKNLKALILSILGIIVAIALATGIFSYINQKNEDTLWEECVSKKQINDLRTYVEKYPDGEHYEEAKAMLDKLVREKEAWDQVRVSNDEDYLRSYIRNHPNGEHLEEARSLLDDVVWSNVITKNSKDAYEQYIKEFPNGKHIGDARSGFDEKLRAELTTGEIDNVRGTVQNFLMGMEEWDENLLLSTCNTQMKNFMGKPQASLQDVKDYFYAYKEKLDSVGFSNPSVDVKKVITSDKSAEYKVSFTTTRRMRLRGAENEVVASINGQGVLDDRFLFKELTMDKANQ
ncbi:MAG: zinc ribbon domain-containing protein [Muribaculaceae bacterium]|nr:zinc ribbon domain-containing protein [Muribaculaceae bacterium]